MVKEEALRELGPGGDTIEPASASLRILVAEDNAFNQRVIRSALRRHGCEPDIVADGRAAVEAAMRRRYDLVLMDIEMPELDGRAAAREILAQLAAEERPRIVAVTSLTEPDELDACLAAGMLDVLGKPLDVLHLAAVLRACPRRTS